MDSSANITSLDALRQMRTSMLDFESNVRDALTSLGLEVRKAVAWLEEDRRQYWPFQVRRASDELVEARNALERCQLKYGSEDPPSCYEQKKAYEKAKRRLRYCEEKVQVTKHWIRKLRHEVTEFESQVARMNSALDGDVPRAVAALEKMLTSLEKYASNEAPTSTARRPTISPSQDSSPRPSSEEGNG